MLSISHYTHIHLKFIIEIKNNDNKFDKSVGFMRLPRRMSATDSNRLNLALGPFGFETWRKTESENCVSLYRA